MLKCLKLVLNDKIYNFDFISNRTVLVPDNNILVTEVFVLVTEHFASSYAREFQAKLKELQDSKVAAAAALVNGAKKSPQPNHSKDHNGNNQVNISHV